MTAHEILSEIRSLGDRLEARGDRLHIEVPAGSVTAELKLRLAERKAELLELLEGEADLVASRERLEAAHISIAIEADGTIRLIHDHDASVAAKAGAEADQRHLETPADDS